MQKVIVDGHRVSTINSGYCTQNRKYQIEVNNICPLCGSGTVMDEYTYDSLRMPTYFVDANSENDIEFRITGVYKCMHCKKVFIIEHIMKNQDAILVECKHKLEAYEKKLNIVNNDDSILKSVSVAEQLKLKLDITELKRNIGELEDNISKANAVEVKQLSHQYTASEVKVSDDINNMSTKFYAVYKQALIAKNAGLSEIYGMAFRKCIEYLVTDYALNFLNEDEEVVRKKSLHNRITDYFKFSEAQDFLMAVKWIGNDEVHYFNDNTDEEVKLCELFIEDALDYICKEIRKKRATAIVTARGKKK